MKIQELRIGNWFIDYSNKPFQWDLEYSKLLTLERNRPDIDEVIKSPIQLTEEILLKCGFSDKDYKQGYTGVDYKNGAMTFDFVLNNPGVMGDWNKCYTFSLPDYRFVNIDYLHQLQNLFFDLTGKELDVEL